MADALGRAMVDYQRGGLRGRCLHRDGDTVWDANVAGHYFTPPDEWVDDAVALYESLDGPILDVGCGAGQHALFLAERGREVVAFDVSPGAVEAARDRLQESGVAGDESDAGGVDLRVLDVFEMDFRTNRFRSVLCNGTQIGLAGSLPGVRQLLSAFAEVTDDEGVAVVDSYDPGELDPDEFGGYRSDPRDGVARRTFHVEYHRERDDGTVERLVGDSLSFVLFGPDRLRDATVGTPWDIADVHPRSGYYKARLVK